MGNRGSIIVNLLTVLVFLATACSGVYFLALFFSPGSGINLFPPPTIPAIAVLPTPTDTPSFPTLPPEWTPTPPSQPTDTPIPGPSDTPSATPTSAETATATETPTGVPLDSSVTPDTPTPSPTGPTPTPSRTLSPFQFTLQDDGIQYIHQFAYPDAGCNWMGIAGQVFDLNGNSLIGDLVHLEGGGLSIDAVTGTKSEYGLGGYEHILDTTPKDTTKEYVLQVLDPGGAPLSDQIVVPTFADCNRNLILVNFVQNH